LKQQPTLVFLPITLVEPEEAFTYLESLSEGFTFPLLDCCSDSFAFAGSVTVFLLFVSRFVLEI